MEKLYNINHKLNKRILENPEFTNNSTKITKLSDPVILYNDGKNWKIVPLSVMLMYPVIHDLYYETSKNNKKDTVINVTIYVCPYTLFSAVYFGEFIPNNQVYNNNLTLLDIHDKDQLFIPILDKLYSVSTKTINNKYIRRNEVRLMTLRNAISMYPDCVFLDIVKISKLDPVSSISNKIEFPAFKYSDEYPPKTLVYIIEYKSKKINDYKYSVIVPKTTNAFDITKNGFNTYFNNMIDKIRNKGGIIYTCFWFAWNGIDKQSKVIKL